MYPCRSVALEWATEAFDDGSKRIVYEQDIEKVIGESATLSTRPNLLNNIDKGFSVHFPIFHST